MGTAHNALGLLTVTAAVVAVALASVGASAAEPKPGETDKTQAKPQFDVAVEPAPLVNRLLNDDLTAKKEKQRLRVFHGLWEKVSKENLPVALQARLALQRFELQAPIWQNAKVPARLKAKAALRRGEPEKTLALLRDTDDPRDRLLRARAHQALGERAKAVAVLTPVRERLLGHEFTGAPKLTAGAQAVALLARLEARPAADYHLVMRLLGKAHQRIDPLYWPAHLAEARLLLAKHNRSEAMQALKEATRLNPRCGQAWYLMGKTAVSYFNFDRANKAAEQLKAINPDHPLLTLLKTRLALQQREPDGARDTLAPLLQRFPNHRQALAHKAAVEGLAYDTEALNNALARFDELAKGSAQAHVTAGTFLSTARQYDVAERVLREAVDRAPNWARPRTELGLLLMQMGQLQQARRTLEQATELDPFHVQAKNQLELVRSLLTYETLETEHFVIRYKRGRDAVLARDMTDQLERIYEDVTKGLKHEPAGKTQIDLMPSESHFAVRITGMPDIWTIAAATGPVIALTPPKVGAKQRGAFNWANVLRHEFVHTVTLDRTANRLPHWYTEGVAVSMETTGRSYNDCKLLASALKAGKLFPLDEINWGFIRPETPRDRPLAYAQAAWIIQYLTEKHGHDSVLQLMRLYNEGVGNVAAIEKISGVSGETFFSRFKAWATKQVKRWGLASGRSASSEPSPLDRMFEPTPAQRIERWRVAKPSADALKRRAKRRVQRVLGDNPLNKPLDQVDVAEALRAANQGTPGADAYAKAEAAVWAYAAARPIDPWIERALAQLALRGGRTEQAVPSLARLNRQSNRTGAWAFQLAKLHREAGRLTAALAASEQALDRESYNARYRELAATLALQNSRPKRALHHLRAMATLEPKVAIHHVRLAALHARLGQDKQATKHAKQARELNAEAPVGRFLDN